MPYRLVKGSFHLFYVGERRVGARPDGDSVWFRPDHPEHLESVGGRSAKYNGGGFTQLRFEAVDATEVHCGPKQNHQEVQSCCSARAFLLKQLGFKTVTFCANAGDMQCTVQSADPHPRPGYILTRSIDPYGRPVSFAYAGASRLTDGDDGVYLDTDLLAKSVNAQLAQSGEVYPAFYTGLPTDLRDHITSLADAAWQASRGLWPRDVTMGGARIASREEAEKLVLWPKLFRRLIAFYDDGHTALGDFEAWLREDPARDDQVWMISAGELGNLHDVISVSRDSLAMTFWPEDLVVVPR
jgi:hypothetical protein